MFGPQPSDEKTPALISWQQLAELIAAMPAEDRAKPVLSQNGNTGAYFGFVGIHRTEDDQDLDLPANTPVLTDDNNWFYYQNGVAMRSRHDPH